MATLPGPALVRRVYTQTRNLIAKDVRASSAGESRSRILSRRINHLRQGVVQLLTTRRCHAGLWQP